MDATKHDPLDQNQEENLLVDEEIETVTDTADVQAAEESAVNVDTDAAREASGETLPAADQEVLEEEAALVEEALEKKGRESTSEKSKKAAAERAMKTGKEEVAPQKQLDPLRLRGKQYRAKVQLVDRSQSYDLTEAIELVKQLSYAKFDGAVEAHFRLKADGVRGTVSLPHGTGKTVNVAVADEDTIAAIAAGNLDFDVLIATPAQMPALAKFAKVLGPKGLMPSPKAGTVTEDVEKARAEIGGGRIEYRADKTGVVHTVIGRQSFKTEQLVENYQALEQAIAANGKILSVSLAPTMGPGVKLNLAA